MDSSFFKRSRLSFAGEAALALAALLAGAAFSSVAAGKEPLPVKFEMKTNQKWNLVVLEQPESAPEVKFTGKVKCSGLDEVSVSGRLLDAWGNEEQALKGFTLKRGEEKTAELSFKPAHTGAWTFVLAARGQDKAEGKDGVAEFKGAVGVAVVPPPVPGPRRESFFASNAFPGWNGEKCGFDSAAGLKVYRNHLATPEYIDLDPDDAGDLSRYNYAKLDKMMSEVERSGMTVGVGIIGYAFPNWLSLEAKAYNKYGPPADNQAFADCVARIIQRYNPKVPYWEIWNEPWIYGWNFAGSPAVYQDMHKRIVASTKALGVNAQFLCGHSSSFLCDNIMPDPECLKDIVAESNHPYAEGGEPNLRKGSKTRYIDYAVQLGKACGFPKHFITENGTEFRDEATDTKDSPQNAAKIVVMFVQAVLCGIYQGNVQEGLGWGPSQPRGTVAFAVASRFLEDHPVVADIWPAHPLIWGAVFANPKHIDDELRKLPRADEISARWQVPVPPERADDQTKVAVVWSYTGPDDMHLDGKGSLCVSDAADMRAYDCMGVETGSKSGSSLTIPFGERPVFITTEQLTAAELYRRIRDAKMEGLTPLNFSIQSLAAPPEEKPSVTALVQNQLNRTVKAKVSLKGPEGWSFAPAEQELELKPAEIKEVKFAITNAASNDANLYPLTISAETDAGAAERRQIAQAARFLKRAIVADGDLSDWKGVPPVSIDSEQVANVEDWARYTLNLDLKRPEGKAEKPRVSVKSWAAYDERNVYLAYAVSEPELKNSAGKAWGRPPHPKYRQGVLDGIGFPFHTGDAIQAVFGFRDRAKDDFRKPGDSWRWKGFFRDTDYQYLIYASKDGPQLLRIHKPGAPYRVSFQCVAHPGQGPVEGGKVAIRRDEQAKMTYYELSIPRGEMPEFEPGEMKSVRYGFVLSTSEGVGYGGFLQWAQACGVFDYWSNGGSFQPSWASLWPCQTPWGIEK